MHETVPRYDLARVANTILLELVPTEPRLITEVVNSLGTRVSAISEFHPTFDFSYWGRGTVVEIVRFLHGTGLVKIEAHEEDLVLWDDVKISLTAEGTDYIYRARNELTEVFNSLGAI
jgi:hypothetical protein